MANRRRLVVVLAVAMAVACSSPGRGPATARRVGPRGGDPKAARERYDEPLKARDFFALKRAPVGRTTIPVERYRMAREQMTRMPLYSTRSGAFAPTAERGPGRRGRTCPRHLEPAGARQRGGADARPRHQSRYAHHHVRRRGGGRGVEDDQRRHELERRGRRPGQPGRDHAGPAARQPQHHPGRNRRGVLQHRRRARGGDLPLDGRRRELDPDRTARRRLEERLPLRQQDRLLRCQYRVRGHRHGSLPLDQRRGVVDQGPHPHRGGRDGLHPGRRLPRPGRAHRPAHRLRLLRQPGPAGARPGLPGDERHRRGALNWTSYDPVLDGTNLGTATYLTEAGMGRTSLAIAPGDQDVIYAVAADSRATPCGRSTTPATGERAGKPGRPSPAWGSRACLLFTNLPFAWPCSGLRRSYLSQGWYDNVVAVDPVESRRRLGRGHRSLPVGRRRPQLRPGLVLVGRSRASRPTPMPTSTRSCSTRTTTAPPTSRSSSGTTAGSSSPSPPTGGGHRQRRVRRVDERRGLREPQQRLRGHAVLLRHRLPRRPAVPGRNPGQRHDLRLGGRGTQRLGRGRGGRRRRGGRGSHRHRHPLRRVHLRRHPEVHPGPLLHGAAL